jgi:hypothetical protein
MQKSLSVPFATALLSNVATTVNIHNNFETAPEATQLGEMVTEHMLTSTQDFSFAQVMAFADIGKAGHVCDDPEKNKCETQRCN